MHTPLLPLSSPLHCSHRVLASNIMMTSYVSSYLSIFFCLLFDTCTYPSGKTFREASVRWFPVHHVHSVDAILLTHGHADAIFGLDVSLRMPAITTGYAMLCYVVVIGADT